MDLVNLPTQPAGDEDLIAALVAAANGEPIRLGAARPAPLEVEPPDAPAWPGRLWHEPPDQQAARYRDWARRQLLQFHDPQSAEVRRLSQWAEAQLTAFLDNPLSAIADYLPIAAEVQARIRVKIVFTIGKRGLTRDYFHDFKNAESALQFAYGLLLDDRLPFGADLSWCRYKACKRFFLVRPDPSAKGGPPPRAYCCRKHGIQANNRKMVLDKRESA